jgi:hypothetical protein
LVANSAFPSGTGTATSASGIVHMVSNTYSPYIGSLTDSGTATTDPQGGVLNLTGGTLTANSGATSLINNNTSAYSGVFIWNNGATFSSNATQNTAISTTVSSSSGVTITNSGYGNTGIPNLTISSIGTTSGAWPTIAVMSTSGYAATAVPLYDANGNLTGISITNCSAPLVTVPPISTTNYPVVAVNFSSQNLPLALNFGTTPVGSGAVCYCRYDGFYGDPNTVANMPGLLATVANGSEIQLQTYTLSNGTNVLKLTSAAGEIMFYGAEYSDALTPIAAGYGAPTAVEGVNHTVTVQIGDRTIVMPNLSSFSVTTTGLSLSGGTQTLINCPIVVGTSLESPPASSQEGQIVV